MQESKVRSDMVCVTDGECGHRCKKRIRRGGTKFGMQKLQSNRKQEGRWNVSRFRWKAPKTRKKVPKLWYRDTKTVLEGKHRFRYTGKKDTGETHKSLTKVGRQGQRGEVKITTTPQKKTLKLLLFPSKFAWTKLHSGMGEGATGRMTHNYSISRLVLGLVFG